MGSKPISATEHDRDKSKEQLLSELQELRAQVAILDKSEGKTEAAVEALRESEGRMSLAQQVASIGTFEWNIQTGVDTWTPELEAMYGLPKGGFPGTEPAWEQLVYPEDRAEAVRCLSEAIENGYFESEWRVVWPDGTVRWLHGKGWVFKDNEGKPLKLIGVNIDITERKQADVELQNYRKHLECLVQERTRKLEDVNARLQADIAERKRAEEVLKKLRANLEKSQEIAHLGSWELDLVTNTLSWSDEAYRIFGLQPREFGATYEAFLAVIHPDDRAAVDAAFTGSIRDGRDTYEIEHRVVRRSTGEIRYVHEKCEHVRDKSGRVVRSVGMVHDITERKRTEDALRESRAHLNSVFRAAPTGIGVVVDRVIQEVNDRLCEMTGYTREELLGKDARIFYPSDEDYEYVGREKYARIERFGTGTVETRWRRKDGGIIDVLLSSTPLKPGDHKAGVTFTALDITERKRAEEALRESEERYRALVETSPDGIIVHQRDGKYLYANPAALRLYGADSLDQLQKYNVLDLIYPEDREQIAARIRHVDKGGIIPLHEGRLLRLDGRYVYYECTGTQINYGGGEAIQVILRDITKRKLAEEALVDAKAQAELYLDLMGHDINNLHQIALGYLEMARDMPSGENQSAFLEKPIEVLQRSAQLIGNVRKLQKLRDGVFQMQDVNMGQVLADVQREYGGIPNKRVTLNVNGQADCRVRANELLYDVFVNLVSNAVRHTGDKADITIDLNRVDDNGSYYRVMVEDNGPGIPDDSKGKIFNRMHKGMARGMGLGLYLVRSLVNSYGGRVWVEDRVKGDHSQGARFVVLLPIVEK